MRLKTYIAIYLLILTVLFSSVGIVSFYLMRSQIEMLKNKSEGQFHTISSSLARDISAIYQREVRDSEHFHAVVQSLVSGYAMYYRRHNINIDVTHAGTSSALPVITLESNGNGYFIQISGPLPEPHGYFLDYTLNITQNIGDMRDIQNILLLSAVAFSAGAAVALHFIRSAIFRPLAIVAKTSRKIAGGNFGERIPVGSNSELDQVAHDFNKMAERIENQIGMLEIEAENKQQFVDNFAHEMRTPLTSIYGFAEYMQKARLDEGEIIEISGRIMHKASYLRDIASSLLQLAMLRDYTPEICEISVPQLFEDTTQTIKGELDAAGINFSCKIDAQTLRGQEDLIKCLLLNLCQNALRATSENPKVDGDTRFIEMAAKTDASGGIALSVRDNGCGIPRESLAKVTDPFYRVDKSRNREGAGLGLTLCKKIADTHGAKLRILSEIGIGTTVEISFTTP
ncbi:MAG: HAMP domain-containing histidine kinase [Defluviitaleaceae bacterium]|nr:HAMP domain-containing histidine kinase [Defluviitaleaceae bacterium]